MNIKNEKFLSDIAYKKNKSYENAVYIKENGVFKPYIVLTSDYNGNVLLLRKFLLDETMPFNENESHMWAGYENGGYYENSSIDKYLNNNFIQVFDDWLQQRMPDSEITITAENSLGVTGEDTLTISRKIFLLSLFELDAGKSQSSVAEGKALKYFTDDYLRRVACFSNGEKNPYWTRTPETWETYTVFTVGENGIGSASADILSGVRPAFCLDANTAIHLNADIINNKNVYVIDNNFK